MKQFLISILVVLYIPILFAQTIGDPPVVSNVVMWQNQNNGLIYVTYDLSIQANPVPCHVTLVISGDEGVSFKIHPLPEFIEGDFGDYVTVGTGKQIIWDIYRQSQALGSQGVFGNTYRARVIARRNDFNPVNPAPAGFVSIEGGTFHNGTSNITISSFYIDRYEVTQVEYEAVMGTNPSDFSGSSNLQRPVEQVSWFNAIEYCNRRSMQEGLIPCYSYSTFGTNPDNWPVGWDFLPNHTNVTCNWNVNGYRLPTEMEWMFVAKGGNQSQNYTYSGSNTIDLVAWYYGNSDIGDGQGRRSHEIGTKTPNELGIYDMSGNVWEWVWDMFSYDYPSNDQTNPTGPSVEGTRVVRGGCWNQTDNNCTNSTRGNSSATIDFNTHGFRIVRRFSMETVATPVFFPSPGTYASSQMVSISCSTPGATIYYTTNGSEPNTNSTIYTGAITVNSNTTVKAKAYKASFIPSDVVEGIYIINTAPANMILISGGTFTMGRTTGTGGGNELPTHSITLNSFYLGKYEITQGEYEAILGSNPASGAGEGEDFPVYEVSWYSAIKYCNLRSMAEGLVPAYTIDGSTDPGDWGAVPETGNATWDAVTCNWNANGYRLPTEAEWEYAARGAVNNPDYLYSGSDDIDDVAWFEGNNNPWGTKQIGLKDPNVLGLHDLSGNVIEWCWDWYSYSYYSESSANNPTGPSTGTYRIARGGDWSLPENSSRVSARGFANPEHRSLNFGFRVCFNAPTVATPTIFPVGGTYYTSQSVTIDCSTNGAAIYYSINGSDPDENSTLYNGPISLSSDTMLKAKAYMTNWEPSGIASAEYTFDTIQDSLILVQGGTFHNGVSNVTLSSFFIDKYEVTQSEYLAVMGTNPGSNNSEHGDPLNHPINNVTWFNAIEYCNRLSIIEGLTPAYSYSNYGTNPDDWPSGWNTSSGNHTNVSCDWSADGYCLPTEMQWEYAARGGIPAQNAGTFNDTYAGTDVQGTGTGQLGDYAWYIANAGLDLPGGSTAPDYGTHPVGTKLPNELGIYDMSGNVWNWVWDIHGSYPSGSYTNPTGSVSGAERVCRGGGSDAQAVNCTVSNRGDYYATGYSVSIGFRISRKVP
jgi:formylglycine-generating enzyme required for sulfatase activity